MIGWAVSCALLLAAIGQSISERRVVVTPGMTISVTRCGWRSA
jgi:hypothetical protein